MAGSGASHLQHAMGSPQDLYVWCGICSPRSIHRQLWTDLANPAACDYPGLHITDSMAVFVVGYLQYRVACVHPRGTHGRMRPITVSFAVFALRHRTVVDFVGAGSRVVEPGFRCGCTCVYAY